MLVVNVKNTPTHIHVHDTELCTSMLFSPIMLDKFERTQKDTKALHTFEHCSCAFLNSSLMLIDFWRPARPLKRLHLAQKMFVVAGMRDAGFPR